MFVSLPKEISAELDCLASISFCMLHKFSLFTLENQMLTSESTAPNCFQHKPNCQI